MSQSQNFMRIFNESIFTDFDLKCNDGETLNCHKWILAARSPVFEAMFSSIVKETLQGFADIEDFDSVIMREVIFFIYSGNSNLTNLASKIIFAAEKFQLETLKEKCIDRLYEDTTEKNVIEMLHIAEKLSGCEKLLQKIVLVVAK